MTGMSRWLRLRGIEAAGWGEPLAIRPQAQRRAYCRCHSGLIGAQVVRARHRIRPSSTIWAWRPPNGGAAGCSLLRRSESRYWMRSFQHMERSDIHQLWPVLFAQLARQRCQRRMSPSMKTVHCLAGRVQDYELRRPTGRFGERTQAERDGDQRCPVLLQLFHPFFIWAKAIQAGSRRMPARVMLAVQA